jgi:hypothetical protein
VKFDQREKVAWDLSTFYYWAQQHVAKLGMRGIRIITSSFDSGKGNSRHIIPVRRGTPSRSGVLSGPIALIWHIGPEMGHIPQAATRGINLDYCG